jgi:hypothetical protein
MRRGREVSASEIAELKVNAVRDPSLGESSPGADWFRLADGRILFAYVDLIGRVYTAAEFDQLKAEPPRKEFSEHYLYGHELPDDFVAQVPTLLERCRKWMGSHGESLDLTIDGLIRIDNVRLAVGKEQSFSREVFPLIVAAVGETMRREKEGRWELRTVKDSRNVPFSEVWVSNDAGWSWDASWATYKAVDEDTDLRTIVGMAVRERGWAKKVRPVLKVFRDVDARDPAGGRTKKDPSPKK